jgi:hypothetical protein
MITLTTDFGSSGYVGAMKGMIYSICPNIKVIDITHNIRKFDVRHASYVVLSTSKYFPKGTIHCVVVDPGVGTKRRGIIIETKDYIFIGPDNGVFSFVGDVENIYEISSSPLSKTFHGRDIFAPIAAKIACGAVAKEFGNPIKRLERIEIKKPELNKNKIVGEVFCIDHFGNVITNIRKDPLNNLEIDYDDAVRITINGKKRKLRFVESYGFAEKNELIALIGSEGYLEIAVNQGDASKMLDVQGSEKIEVTK